MFPARRRFSAWIALLAFSATFGLGFASSGHNSPDDDAACGQIALSNGHARVQIEPATNARAATHCPFCHWQRAVSGASVVAANAAVVSLDAVGLLRPTTTRALRSVVIDGQSSRGPPLRLT